MMGFGWQACTLAAMAAASVWASLIPVEIPPDAGLPGLSNGTSEGANLTNSTSCTGPGEGHLGQTGSSGSELEEPASAGDWLSGFKEWLLFAGGAPLDAGLWPGMARDVPPGRARGGPLAARRTTLRGGARRTDGL